MPCTSFASTDWLALILALSSLIASISPGSCCEPCIQSHSCPKDRQAGQPELLKLRAKVWDSRPPGWLSLIAGLWFAWNEGMEKKMETTIMGLSRDYYKNPFLHELTKGQYQGWVKPVIRLEPETSRDASSSPPLISTPPHLP